MPSVTTIVEPARLVVNLESVMDSTAIPIASPHPGATLT